MIARFISIALALLTGVRGGSGDCRWRRRRHVYPSWNRTITETMIEDGFPPPTASRNFSYAHIAAYEAMYRIDHGSGRSKDSLPDCVMCPLLSRDPNNWLGGWRR